MQCFLSRIFYTFAHSISGCDSFGGDQDGHRNKGAYSVVQKDFPLFENSRLNSSKQNGQPMHSQLALTENVSLNLAPLILLDPVLST